MSNFLLNNTTVDLAVQEVTYDIVTGKIQTGGGGSGGSTGPAGPAGSNGTGFTGSTGSAGTTGSAGSTGPTGSAGLTGSTGPTGSTGFTGYTGPTGSFGGVVYKNIIPATGGLINIGASGVAFNRMFVGETLFYGDLLPANSNINIGSTGSPFKSLYVSSNTIYIGQAVLQGVDTTINLPAGSTLGGVPLGTITIHGAVPTPADLPLGPTIKAG